jgi:hypothetical protein
VKSVVGFVETINFQRFSCRGNSIVSLDNPRHIFPRRSQEFSGPGACFSSQTGIKFQTFRNPNVVESCNKSNHRLNIERTLAPVLVRSFTFLRPDRKKCYKYLNICVARIFHVRRLFFFFGWRLLSSDEFLIFARATVKNAIKVLTASPLTSANWRRIFAGDWTSCGAT